MKRQDSAKHLIVTQYTDDYTEADSHEVYHCTLLYHCNNNHFVKGMDYFTKAFNYYYLSH